MFRQAPNGPALQRRGWGALNTITPSCPAVWSSGWFCVLVRLGELPRKPIRFEWRRGRGLDNKHELLPMPVPFDPQHSPYALWTALQSDRRTNREPRIGVISRRWSDAPPRFDFRKLLPPQPRALFFAERSGSPAGAGTRNDLSYFRRRQSRIDLAPVWCNPWLAAVPAR